MPLERHGSSKHCFCHTPTQLLLSASRVWLRKKRNVIFLQILCMPEKTRNIILQLFISLPQYFLKIKFYFVHYSKSFLLVPMFISFSFKRTTLNLFLCPIFPSETIFYSFLVSPQEYILKGFFIYQQLNLSPICFDLFKYLYDDTDLDLKLLWISRL